MADQHRWVSRIVWLLVIGAALVFLGWPYALVIAAVSLVPALVLRWRSRSRP